MPRSPSGPRICILGEPGDGHARKLVKHFSQMGANATITSLRDCNFDTTARHGLTIKGMNGELPDAVFVRTIPAGSFEAVTKRLGILHALRECGVLVWNDARAVERCVDKSMTSFLLQQAGIPTPPTWTVERQETALQILATALQGGPVVLKPLFGSQGRGLRLLKKEQDLPPPEAVAGTYYLQRFIAAADDNFHDYRVFVINGRALAAMSRHNSQWITNVKQGGRPCIVLPDPELHALAVRAAEAVGTSYCGVDIIRTADGAPLVLEVNSMPAWSGLQKVIKLDIARELAAALLDAIALRQHQLRDAG